jgi:hypothetical protein
MARAPRHRLINIITIVICAVICGADNVVTMAEFGRSKKKWFESFLSMPNGGRVMIPLMMSSTDSTSQPYELLYKMDKTTRNKRRNSFCT